MILISGLLLPITLFAQVADSTGRVVKMEGAANFRDIGGYKTQNGTEVVKGKIYRSADISKLTDRDMEQMAARRIFTVIDFRGTKEAAAAPDRQLPDMDYTLCPAGSDSLPAIKDMAALVRDENFLLSAYGKPGVNYFGERYKPLFDKLLTLRDDETALLYHCTGGRDRTGMATALVLYALGVPMETIEADFVASNIYLKSFNKEMFRPLVQLSGLSLEEVEERMKLRPELLRTFFKTLTDEYGSVELFMQKELGIGEPEITLLKSKYTK